MSKKHGFSEKKKKRLTLQTCHTEVCGSLHCELHVGVHGCLGFFVGWVVFVVQAFSELESVHRGHCSVGLVAPEN